MSKVLAGVLGFSILLLGSCADNSEVEAMAEDAGSRAEQAIAMAEQLQNDLDDREDRVRTVEEVLDY